MRRNRVPIVALLLAVAWCTAQLLDSPVLAAVVTVAALGMTMGLGSRQRVGKLLPWSLVGVAAVLAAWLAVLLVTGSRSLVLQLVMLGVLAPLLPLLYAATFPDREESRRRDGGS